MQFIKDLIFKVYLTLIKRSTLFKGLQSLFKKQSELNTNRSYIQKSLVDIGVLEKRLETVRRKAQNSDIKNMQDYLASTEFSEVDGIIEHLKKTLENANLNSSSYESYEKSNKDFISKLKDQYSRIDQKREDEAIEKSADFWHKVLLTLLRIGQIFAFIWATYTAIDLMVDEDQRDLVIPRGLINIVPSSPEVPKYDSN